jgi:hypothetical protein
LLQKEIVQTKLDFAFCIVYYTVGICTERIAKVNTTNTSSNCKI